MVLFVTKHSSYQDIKDGNLHSKNSFHVSHSMSKAVETEWNKPTLIITTGQYLSIQIQVNRKQEMSFADVLQDRYS